MGVFIFFLFVWLVATVIVGDGFKGFIYALGILLVIILESIGDEVIIIRKKLKEIQSHLDNIIILLQEDENHV